jgi:aminopeptidase N
MKRTILSIVVFAGVLISSCDVTKEVKPVVEKDSVKSESSATAATEESELPKSRGVYHASETIKTDLVHTELQVEFDWNNSRLLGLANITAKPHFYSTDSLILDAKGMEINSVHKGGSHLEYTYKDDYLRIKLDKVYKRGEIYTVTIDYIAKPDEYNAKGSAAIMDAKGLYFINPKGEDPNKMPQIWTQGETEASSVWFPTIDSPNAKTTQEIKIIVDDKYTTLSNGKLIASNKLPNGKRIDHWKQELPHAPYLFMMGVGEFKVVTDSYTRPNGSKMEVNYYVEPEWESSAKAIFGETPEMIRFFSDLLKVEYPWDKYHQIVVRDYVSGAMENTGAVVFGDFVYKNERELLDANDQSTIAHELFHHWFGDLVTCESWSNLPLNESFANYSQYLWDEHRYGIDEADYHAEGEADGYYQSAGVQGHHDLIWFDYDDKEQMFDGHSYNKGGRILHMLRNYLGDEAFFAGVTNYLKANQFKPAEFHQLRLAFEEVSGEDLNWFFNQWFLGSGHPVLTFKHEIDTASRSVSIEIEQIQDLELSPIYKLPMEIALYDDNGKTSHKIVMDELKQKFIFSYSGTLKNIIFDEQQMLLAKKSEDKPVEFYIHQYYNGKRYMARKDGLMIGTKDKGQAGQQLVLDALKDSFWHIRMLAISKMTRLQEENKTKGIEILKKLAVSDEKSAVRAAAVSALSKYLSDEEMNAIYEDRIANDRSYSVVSAALSNLGKKDAPKALELAKALENERSSSMLSGVAQLYASYGGPDKFDFIVSALEGNVVQGFDKLGLVNSFTFYLSKQEPELINRAYSIYEKQGETGGFYMKLFLPQNLRYLTNQLGTKISEMNTELEEHEKNKDVALADQLRKRIAAYEATKERYEQLIIDLDSESGGAKMLIQQSEEE